MAERPSSITRRLFAATLLSMPVLLILTGIAIDRAHHSSLLQAENDRLQLQFFGILGAMEWRDGAIEMADRLKEPRFWQFRSGLFADIRDANGRELWRSLSGETMRLPLFLDQPRPGQAVFGETEIDNAPYFSYRYLAIWEGDNGEDIPLSISLYSQQGSLRAELNRFRRQLALWLSLVLLVSLVLSTLILYWGLRPLRQLAQDLLRLERGDSRQLARHYPRELANVTDNLNLLLESEQRQRERYRNTLADLAHSLKTPLAVLRAEPDDADIRRQQLERMENIITYQLNRAVSGSGGAFQQRTELGPLLDSLRNTLLKVYHQKAPDIQVSLPEHFAMAADKQDLLEIFGNIMDNACKACREKIQVSTEGDRIHIDDDGAGISQQQAAKLVDRGRRGDQYGQGQGLGLSIVKEILESYRGSLEFGQSPLGGCRVSLKI